MSQRNHVIPKDKGLAEYILCDKRSIEIINGENVFYTVRVGKNIYELNLVGSLIFESIKSNLSLCDIEQLLIEIYGEENKTIINSTTKDFLKELQERGVLLEGE